MVEFHRTPDSPATDGETHRMCIMGVGGAGSNVLDCITLERTMDAKLVCVHTDVRVLGRSMAPGKVQLGTDLMRGVGAGGDPDLGREAALFSRDAIRLAVEGSHVIFICVGLGGGTGSGAAPVIAEIAKSTGALVLVVATMPFAFEGRRRVVQAEESLSLLQKRADALILFENSRMGELILPKDGIQKAFSAADQLISQSLRAVATMISTPGLVKLGLDDLKSALASSDGRCLFGFGEARGQNRGQEALKRALKSPLIDQGRLLHQTRHLLVHVAGGETLTLMEVESIMKQVGKNVPDHTHILFGVAVDVKLGDAVAVTLISSLGVEELRTQDVAQAERKLERERAIAAEKNARMTPARRTELELPKLESDSDDPHGDGELELAATPPGPSPADQLASDLAPPLELFGSTEIAVASTGSTLIQAVIDRGPRTLISAKSPADTAPESIPDEVVFEPSDRTMGETTPVVEPEAETARVPVMDREAIAAVSSPANLQVEQELPATRSLTRPTKESDDDMFKKGALERGRFKDTEPSMVEGEDLDVPTWMRLKKRLKKS